MRGLIGKALRGAAAVYVPWAMEDHQAKLQEQRDARIEALAMEREGRLNERADRAQALEMADRGAGRLLEAGQREREYALDERRTSASEAQSQASIRQSDSAIKRIDQEIEAGDLSLADARELAEVRERIAKAATPEERADATRLFFNMSKQPTTKTFMQSTTDALGNETEQPITIDLITGGQVTRADSVHDIYDPDEDVYTPGATKGQKGKTVDGPAEAPPAKKAAEPRADITVEKGMVEKKWTEVSEDVGARADQRRLSAISGLIPQVRSVLSKKSLTRADASIVASVSEDHTNADLAKAGMSKEEIAKLRSYAKAIQGQ